MSAYRTRFPVADYLDDQIGISYRSSEHGELVLQCPWCGGKNKLWVNAGSGLWTCYRCGEGGGLLGLVAQLEGLTAAGARAFVSGRERESLATTITAARRRMNGQETETSPGAAAEPTRGEATSLPLPEGFQPVYDAKVRQWKLPAYLKIRKIRPSTARAYGLGYCPTGEYAGRLIFPCHMDGRIAYYQGRLMVPGGLKYTGPGGTKGPIVYGLDEAAGTSHVVVCEGPTDVLSLAQRGFTAVGCLGKRLTPGHATILRNAGFRSATVLYDNDPKPGAKRGEIPNPDEAAETLGAVLGEVTVAMLPQGLDPATASLAQIEDALASARRPSMRGRLGHANV